jgi:hypothetical protein
MNIDIESPNTVSSSTPVIVLRGKVNGKPSVLLAVLKDSNLMHAGTVNGVPCHFLAFENDSAAWQLGSELVESFDRLKHDNGGQS